MRSPTHQAIVSSIAEHNRVGRFADALALVDRALERNAGDGKLLVARASILFEWGRFIEARNTLVRARAAGTLTEDLALKLGWCCVATGMHGDAVQCMTAAIATNPDSVEARFGLATASSNLGDKSQAQTQLELVLTREPRHYQSLLQLGEHKLASSVPSDAERLFRRAIEAEPDNPAGWLMLGTALDRQGRLKEAIEAVETAQRLEDQSGIDIENFVNLAIFYSDAGRFEEAREILEANLPAKPGPRAYMTYAFLLLRVGRLLEGWNYYEFRLMQRTPADRAFYGKPPWTGESLDGRRILVSREQGFGDTIQFVRYAQMLKALGATVWLHTGPAMRQLAHNFLGVDRAFSDGEAVPEFDYYVHLASLPRLFATSLATIPSRVPYVAASDEHLAKWKQRIGNVSAFRVGLVWAGHPDHLRDRERSIALNMLMPLTRVERVQLFSLQKGPASAELASLRDSPIEDLSSELNDFSDTAAAVQQMDLVISVDTAVAHLAGAMARPVWLLLPKGCDFRWLESRSTSPWYPTMRLFRQECRGEWDAVVRNVESKLKQHVADRSSPATAVCNDDSNATIASDTDGPAGANTNPRLLTAVSETRVGVIHYLPNDHPIADSMYWYGEHLEAMIEEISRLTPVGATIVEAGAGVGIHSLALANAVGPTGHVILYEARALHRRLLYQNIDANQPANVTIMRRSVAGSPAGAGMETIDQLALERLDLLKIDSPTSHADVIQGAADTIWRLRPLLVMSGVDAAKLKSLVQLARDFSYRCWRADWPLFNPNNFYRRHENVHSGKIHTALFCLAEEKDVDMKLRGFRDI